jgi:hypothetical protein
MIDKLGLDGLGGASVRKPEAVNKLTKLIEAAKAARLIDHNENATWYSVEAIQYQGAHFPKNARFIAACDPATILELCALLEKAEEALKFYADDPWNNQNKGKQALAAIKQWKKQT